ncbi:ABC transporter permease subunit [Neobacillus mesonae]|uniref:ABC transporter permease subunit n=1 Tax=Neobacillus mesonae TaxID=1193713 RepID=UPI0008329D7F|nr:ABC transporter permease subunit [Neobacillus mesonae]
MNNRILKAMIKKEMKSILSSKKLWIPMIIVPLLLCVILPIVVSFLGTHSGELKTIDPDIQNTADKFVEKFPDGEIKTQFLSLDNMNLQLTFLFFNFLIIPFFLLTAIVNSSLIAANSFVGEKERKTLETLLFSPISIKELLISKMIAALLPSIGITYLAYLLCGILVNVIVFPSFHFVFFVSTNWIIFMFILVPFLIIFNILLNIFISAKVKTLQEAQQFGGLMVLPIIAIIISQVSGLFFLSPVVIGVLGVILLVADLFIFSLMIKNIHRNTLFESQIH